MTTQGNKSHKITSIKKLSKYFSIHKDNGEYARLYIVNNNVFHYYTVPLIEERQKCKVYDIKSPVSDAFSDSHLKNVGNRYNINTRHFKISFDKTQGTMTIMNNSSIIILKEIQPISYSDKGTTQHLHQHPDEYYFGGGVHNGKFSHKQQLIEINYEHDSSSDLVSSPCPFFWSTYGYGMLWNTCSPGIYDFGSKDSNKINCTHEDDNFNVFYFINSQPRDLLRDFYELTGKPILLPEFAFYDGHLQLNNTNDKASEMLNDDPSIKDQFSAYAIIDKCNEDDVPLGWIVPNTEIAENFTNDEKSVKIIKKIKEYARKNGVTVGVRTLPEFNEDKHKANIIIIQLNKNMFISQPDKDQPNDSNSISKSNENRNIDIVIVVGSDIIYGHTVILNSNLEKEWMNIKLLIPTFIGGSLSGLPVMGSGINKLVNSIYKNKYIREYQWKSFTPLQYNMDGWGSANKLPQRVNEDIEEIIRAYLKLKSMLMPYNYTINFESITGLPMIRAMFLEYPDDAISYIQDLQYMWGPSILVAPIFNEDNTDGDSLRQEIYLPNSKQIWIDYFTGKKYRGGTVLHNLKVPLWKLPVFIKHGAILPMTDPNNNPYKIVRTKRIFQLYPNKNSNFIVYEDDGLTSDYINKQYAQTTISVVGPNIYEKDNLYINIEKTQGDYNGMTKVKSTLLRIIANNDIKRVMVSISEKQNIHMVEAETEQEFDNRENVYYLKKDFVVNPYLSQLADEELYQTFLLIKIQPVDVTLNDMKIVVNNYENILTYYVTDVDQSNRDILNELAEPNSIEVANETSSTITFKWKPVNGATGYEIKKDNIVFRDITRTEYTFNRFAHETEFKFVIRSVFNNSLSKWHPVIVRRL